MYHAPIKIISEMLPVPSYIKSNKSTELVTAIYCEKESQTSLAFKKIRKANSPSLPNVHTH